MKKNLLSIAFMFLIFVSGFSQSKANFRNKKKNQTSTCVEKPSKEIIVLREKHEKFLKNSPYRITKTYSKKQSLAMGLPPNKYYEENWELSINPETGKPDFEKLAALRKQLESDKANSPQSRNPGDANDNQWIERGPTNVGGRTRAVMFDPNDLTNETAYAGGVSGGLWKNTNISNSESVWTRVGIPENLAVSCITVDPNNSLIWYLGTGESYTGGDANGDGVWKSTDGGATWANVFGGISGPVTFNASSRMVVTLPASISGSYLMIEAPQTFGTFPAITTPITGEIVLAEDGTAASTEGCSAFTVANATAMAGKIAIVRRGTCNFAVKMKNAQNAGAIAAIMMNNNTDNIFAMGGSDPTITIPTAMINKADGDMLQNALLNGATVSISMNPSNGTYNGSVVPGVQHINDIKIRNNGGISEIYAAAGDTTYGSSGSITFLGGTSYGLYKSVDGGITWSLINLPLTAAGKPLCPNDIEIGSDNKIWLATSRSKIYDDGGGKIFSSVDGINFQEKFEVPNADRTQIVVSATNSDKIYAMAEIPAITASGVIPASPATVAIISTNDSFVTTSSKILPVDLDGGIPANDFTRGQAGYDLDLTISPTDDQKIFIGGINIFDSADGGNIWNQKTLWFPGGALQEVHADQHAATFAKNDSSKMLFGNDGGVFYSNDGGTTIGSRNSGFNVTQFYSVGVAPTTNGMPGDNFVAGAQDNGSQMFLNKGPGLNTSEEVQGGDGAYSMFDQDGVDQYRVTNYVYNNRIILFNYATNLQRTINTESAIPGNGSFINPMALDSKLNILYSEYFANPNYRIRRYKNIRPPGTIQKAPLSNPMMNGASTALTVCPFVNPLSSSTLLIGTRNGKLLKITNADQGTTTPTAAVTWTNITGSGFVGSVSDVEYGATENDIFVTFHNFNVASVWYTNDGGVTWQNKEGNLPDLPVKCILQNPLLPNEVIIGTDLGVWGTTNFNDASPVWTRSDNGMQNVRVTDMDLRNDNVVFASTYGRGVFSGAFTNPLSSSTFTKNNKNFSISPNPANSQFNLNIKDFSGKINIQITDINGKQIYNVVDDNFSNQKTIDISNLQSGVYLLKVIGDNIDFAEKLIKN